MEQARFFSWLDRLLSRLFPDRTAALCLNLYEDGPAAWSAELIGADRFDPADPDWACGETAAFREDPFRFRREGGWEAAQAEAVSALTAYLERGSRADVMKAFQAVAAGFVDGDLELVYTASELQP